MANNKKFINGTELITGSQGVCYFTINNQRHEAFYVKKIEAKLSIQSKEIKVLGKTQSIHRSTQATGKGSATLFYVTSIFRELAHEFVKKGKLPYFDIQLTNEDEASIIGRQTVILRDCLLNELVLANIDVDQETLEEQFEFTFNDFDLPEKFTKFE